MKDLLHKFENKRPEIVFEWKDAETDAEGWVVINSLRGGAAGGGTRMRVGLDKREVESLAKTMEVKFTVAGPPIGGAKSGINFDPKDPRKEGVLRRWYAAVTPLLKHYYGTGGDLNVDEIHEVIPITEDCGIWHPQEGVFNGHFQPREAQKINRIGQLRQGVLKVIEDTQYSPGVGKKYVVADMITGYGVAQSVAHYYHIWGGNIQGKKVIVQGWGNVASAGAYYLAQAGAKIVGIIDRVGGIINEEGFTFEEIKDLFLTKNGNEIVYPNLQSFEEINAKIWDIQADVFIPCAASRLITQEQVERMIKSGVQVIAAGANVPFADKEIFFGPIADYADNHLSVIPDFISNCGMARVFAYLMSNDLKELTDQGIFEDTSKIIKDALLKAHAKNPAKTGISKAAFEIALNQLI
ncbi:Glu/Leu/Phe/Val dehydrogenase dimerization domain-containing protein [Fluviicola sp.]|jgi:glutamate dehydrogenase/leucine dehydrogenase|uniref:Glu/Leu/Phe/Val dehydrogenase dimerization domain-containing protein n=1 Tax=Fluviicola sp. TaxID=1917219 RepID=UPI00281896AA|nr:Glu/Leu/Phe/Val dehydrogenase dimerization domain-containing protein [Fluviicola sp.]MDR0802424.1 amino acid dehydrogenase [Fluviicola sp.]